MMDDSDAYDAGDPKAPGYADTLRERADVYRKEVKEEPEINWASIAADIDAGS